MSQTAERFIEVDEERVLVLDRQRGRGARSGIEVDHRLAHLVTVRRGRVVQLEAYWDRRDAFAAAGIEPTG
jgi:ketosteroid isomerase-like protein